MSIAGRCIARSTSSGTVVGPGIARNSRPARTLIGPCPPLLTDTLYHGKRTRARDTPYQEALARVLARRQRRPQRLGACLGEGGADLLAPEGLAAEVAAPHPEPARVVMQDMLVGKAHGAHRLVGDRSDPLGEFRGLALGRGDREAAAVAEAALVGIARGGFGRGD